MTNLPSASHPSELPDSVDVVVIGAGPSGSIAALTLAEAGRSVLVLERRTLLRFHVGESRPTGSWSARA